MIKYFTERLSLDITFILDYWFVLLPIYGLLMYFLIRSLKGTDENDWYQKLKK